MRIYIGGNSGVGKTTIAKQFVKKNGEYTSLSDTQIIMNTYNVKSLSEIVGKKIEIDKLREEYLKYENLIVDGHFNNMKPKNGCFDAFVFIVADSNEVQMRRILDKTRERETDIESVKIEEFQTFNAVKDCGISPIYVLKNQKGKLDETIDMLDEIVKFKEKKIEKLSSRIMTFDDYIKVYEPPYSYYKYQDIDMERIRRDSKSGHSNARE